MMNRSVKQDTLLRRVGLVSMVLGLALAAGFWPGYGRVWAAPSESFTDASIQTYDDRSLLLFPAHRVNEFFVKRPLRHLVQLDLPYFRADAQMLLTPHPEVRLARVTQVSSNPDVVRVSLLFNQPTERVPQMRDGHLYLVDGRTSGGPVLPATPPRAAAMPDTGAEQSTTLYSERAAPVSPALDRARTQAGAGGSTLDRSVTLDFENEDLMTILTALAKKFDLRLFADEGVRGKFSVHAANIRLRDVLKQLLLQREFQYTLQGNNLTVISLGKSGRVAHELLFKDLSLRDALQTLSKMMGVNLVIHESVQDKPVNFYVENLNLDELLDVLISTNDLVKTPYNSNTFIIAGRKESTRFGNKTYRTFKLINAKPDEVIKTITDNKALAEKIDTGNIAINDRINAISAYDTPQNLELIAQVIDNIDEKLKQAVIELRLLEINRTSLKQLGVTLDSYNIKVGDINRLPSNYPIGATLDFLETQSKAKVLASPKVRVVHGKQAIIKIGEIIPVPYFRYESASTTYLGYTPQVYKEYRDVPVGIELNVKPEITRDNEISLDINTTVNSVLDINADGQIHKSERSTNTYVRVKDGETVVLGGLIKQNDSVTKQSPALLNRIPLFKSLLSQAKDSGNDSEMIMLITPHLVNVDTPAAAPANDTNLTVNRTH